MWRYSPMQYPLQHEDNPEEGTSTPPDIPPVPMRAVRPTSVLNHAMNRFSDNGSFVDSNSSTSSRSGVTGSCSSNADTLAMTPHVDVVVCTCPAIRLVEGGADGDDQAPPDGAEVPLDNMGDEEASSTGPSSSSRSRGSGSVMDDEENHVGSQPSIASSDITMSREKGVYPYESATMEGRTCSRRPPDVYGTCSGHVEEDEVLCRICQQAGEPGSNLISPCRCTGTLQFLHMSCLMKWLEFYKEQHPREKPKCELCNYRYNRYRRRRKPSQVLSLVLLSIFFICTLLMVSCIGLLILFFYFKYAAESNSHQQIPHAEPPGSKQYNLFNYLLATPQPRSTSTGPTPCQINCPSSTTETSVKKDREVKSPSTKSVLDPLLRLTDELVILPAVGLVLTLLPCWWLLACRLLTGRVTWEIGPYNPALDAIEEEGAGQGSRARRCHSLPTPACSAGGIICDI